MSANTSATSPSKAGPDGRTEPAGETLVEFSDNRLLIDLCGEHDRNLVQIEEGFELAIMRRGNLLALHGDAETRAQAASVLEGLYARLEEGRTVEPWRRGGRDSHGR